LSEVLDLQRVDATTFIGHSEFPNVRKFGGEVAGQAALAATLTVAPTRHLHCAHSQFLRGGDPSAPVTYRVGTVRDGGSFTTRTVEAEQHGDVILHMTASFQEQEQGLRHQEPSLAAPAPESVPPALDQLAGDPDDVAWATRMMALADAELRFPGGPERAKVRNDGPRPPHQQLWMRVHRPPHDVRTRAAALVYLSDLLLLSTALLPHGLTIQEPALQSATLDHTVWIHEEVDLDDWILYDQRSDWAAHGRGLSHGRFFDRSGRLVATTCQQGLMRVRTPIEGVPR